MLKELHKRPPVNGQKLADGEWADGASPTADNYSNWNLTPGGLVITFNFEQIAPYAGDVNSVLVPYAALEGLRSSVGSGQWAAGGGGAQLAVGGWRLAVGRRSWKTSAIAIL